MKILFVLLLMVSILAARAESVSSLHLIDLAGMPVASPPPPGAELTLAPEANEHGPDFLAVFHGANKVGYIPARYREAMERAMRSGVPLRVRAHNHRPHPVPGRYLQVEIELFPRHPGDEAFSWKEGEVEEGEMVRR